MTLGRSASGAIKIKTDGGLRAVGCACCESSCGCGIQIPQNLRTLVEGGNFTMYGISPDYLTFEDDYWFAEFYPDFPGPGPVFWLAGIAYYPETGCLVRRDYYIEFKDGGQSGYASFGDPEPCFDGDYTTVSGTFTINGEGAYPYYWFGDFEVPPPNLVFT
jgi:hypothetical protein